MLLLESVYFKVFLSIILSRGHWIFMVLGAKILSSF